MFNLCSKIVPKGLMEDVGSGKQGATRNSLGQWRLAPQRQRGLGCWVRVLETHTPLAKSCQCPSATFSLPWVLPSMGHPQTIQSLKNSHQGAKEGTAAPRIFMYKKQEYHHVALWLVQWPSLGNFI